MKSSPLAQEFDMFISYDNGKELLDPEVEAEAQRIAQEMPLSIKLASQIPNGFLTFKQYNCRGSPEQVAAIWNKLSAQENQKWRRVSEIRKTLRARKIQESEKSTGQKLIVHRVESSHHEYCSMVFVVDQGKSFTLEDTLTFPDHNGKHGEHIQQNKGHKLTSSTVRRPVYNSSSPVRPHHVPKINPDIQRVFHAQQPIVNSNKPPAVRTSDEFAPSYASSSSFRPTEIRPDNRSSGFPRDSSWGAASFDSRHDYRPRIEHEDRLGVHREFFTNSPSHRTYRPLPTSVYVSEEAIPCNNRNYQLTHQWPDSGYSRDLGYRGRGWQG
ncbi:hypothetical protein DFH05DRAFT_1519814 [Lentinula detonsa]|uniref:Uncharacterized protein n=1 Tax=Lentinula detonsa TaxID=2804962 RepID=A0A9W8U0S4_9AGAR|nr:hypothetical protein DFH05DRAFT_1519814 [Lentinula detonsa]